VAVTRWRWLDWPGWSRRAVAAGYFALLNWLLLAPSDTFAGTELFPHEDKLVHGVIFSGLAWVVRWAAAPQWRDGRAAWLLGAALAAFAGGIELLQPALTGGDRQFEVADMLCNFTGVAAGWLLFRATAAGAAAPATTEGVER
jgi:hypothetical protein